jgi:hypothetical protein
LVTKIVASGIVHAASNRANSVTFLDLEALFEPS